MVLIRRVTVAFLHLSKDIVIVFTPIYSSLNSTAITKGSRLFNVVKPCWTGLLSGWVTI